MSTALADPPAAPTEQSPTGPDGGAPAPADGHGATARTCANCGKPLADGQDWCLNCGTGAPDSLASRTPTWRSAAVVLTVLAVLVAGAAGAAYAALSKGPAKAAPAVTTVAQAVAPATPPPASTPTTPAAPPTATIPKIGAPTTVKPAVPLPKLKLPVTPPVTPKLPTSPTGAGGAPPVTAPKGSGEGSPVVGEAHPQAMMLDTNAAQTYNPYNYPAANFGDPSLAIDGDNTTGWTATVDPAVAPKMAEGLVIDLNSARKLAAVALTTATPGMTVQVYGSAAATLPASITDPAWVALTPSLLEHKRHARIVLGGGSAAMAAAAKRAYRFITLWISRAPAASVGTPAAPGHVTVDELELFAAKKK